MGRATVVLTNGFLYRLSGSYDADTLVNNQTESIFITIGYFIPQMR